MIEIASSNDFKCIAELNEFVQNWHFLNYPTVFKPYDKGNAERFFEEVLSNSDNKAFVAKIKDKPVGYLLLLKIKFEENAFQKERTIFQLDQIVVTENNRNSGVGEKLMKVAIDHAKANNIFNIELNHWAKNRNANFFFKKNGFECFNQKMSIQFGDIDVTSVN